MALVGANGSGKSTFARLASALLTPTSGVVRVAGLDTRDAAARARIHAEVGVVFQYPEDQIVGTTLEEDVAFGPENLGLPGNEIRARVEEALTGVRLWDHRMRPPHMLSAGQTQRLALAGVLAMRPRCILFDEASTMLDPAGRRELMSWMERLNGEGLSILFITHFMDEAARARRVIVFHQGQVVEDGDTRAVFGEREQLTALGLDLPPAARAVEAMRPALPNLSRGLLTLDEVEQALPEFNRGFDRGAGEEPGAASPPLGEGQHEELIRVENLGHVYLKGTPLAHRALAGASLHVKSGEAYGLLGRTGSGKSTLLQHLNGLLHPQEGTVRVGSFDLNDPTISRREVVRQVGLVFQNPEAQFFEHFVGDEIAFGPKQYPMEETLAERVRWAMELVGLDFDGFKDRPLFTLSGGERRKVALASTLALKPAILLLDEPTAGLDPRSRLDLIENLKRMQTGGLELVLSSHQMGDLALLAQGLTVFERGRDVLSGTTAQVFSKGDALRSYGLEPPIAVQVADALRKKGWPVPVQVVTLEQLAAHLKMVVGLAGETA